MYSKTTNYVLIGAFVSAMLLAAIVSLALISGRTGPSDRYTIVMDNVTDVKFGTQVRYEGYPIGQVEEITPLSDGARMRFRLDVSVRKGWRIPTDSLARIGSSSFLAAKTIDIASGESEATVAPGGRIPAAPASDIFAILARTAGEFSEVSRDGLKPLLKSLNTLAQTLERGAPKITSELIAFSERLNTSLEPVEQVLSGENVAAINRTIANVEGTSGTFATASGELAGTLRKIDRLAANLGRLVADNRGNVDKSLKDIRYTLRAIAQNVDTVIHNLEGTARNMNEFSRLIRQNPGLLLDGTSRPAVSPPSTAKADISR